MDRFTEGYLEAVAFTLDDSDDRMANAHFSTLLILKSRLVCARFQRETAEMLQIADALGYDRYRAGVDFWLTRNGHGAGFWDRKELKPGGLGDKLTACAKSYGDLDAYLGDDGEIHI